MTTVKLSPHDEWVLAHAEYFTAYSFGGRNNIRKELHPTRELAAAAAKGFGRPALVYAVYRTHQALLDKFDGAEENKMSIVISYDPTDMLGTIKVSATEDGIKGGWAAHIFETTDDLEKMPRQKQINLYNALDQTKEPIGKFKDRATGALRLFARARDAMSRGKTPNTTRQDAASTEHQAEAAAASAPSTAPSDDQPATTADSSEAAPATNEEVTDMAGKAKTAKAPKAPKTPTIKKPRELKRGIVYRVKELVLKNPKTSTDDLIAKLNEEFSGVSPSSVATFRQDFLHSMRFLRDKGKLTGVDLD